VKSVRAKICFFNVILLTTLGGLSCTKKEVSVVHPSKVDQSQSSGLTPTQKSPPDPEKLRKKQIQDVMSLVASIETETLRLISPSIRSSQFQVLSFAIDQDLNFKKPNPGFSCHQFKVVWGSSSTQVYATCENPHQYLAEIKMHGNKIEILFISANWAPVIGDFQALTRPDRTCTGMMEAQMDAAVRLGHLTCQNTVYRLGDNAAEELRLDEFNYTSKSGQQVSLNGGIYRDLTKRREVKLFVPVEGAIQVFEKELKVRDDFEHLLKK